jgi:hypothetical protein
MTLCQRDVPPPNLNPLLDLDVYDTFRKYIQHEDNLINNRITWMLTIHGFLYAAYAFTVQKKLEIAQKINDDLLNKILTPDSAGRLNLSSYLNNSILQTEWVIFLIAVIGLVISWLASRSISAAGRASANVQKVFEGQFRVQEAHGVVETVSTAKGLILPFVARGGDRRIITSGFLAARGIPLFLMAGWGLSIVLELILFCSYSPWHP